ncbi:MAG: helix-turn-helix transcriptional regulator [Candidatus Borkfalkiaceae bacterium]|nr:helix-turn-helix transcriptional regulator [Clostridia bacterium]MDY6223357.1 helix-turn-helix transcriptional regulator [Christensenellaceae bacterium]
MEIGKRIRELRQEHNLRQKQLAKSINVAANTLSQFESGKANPGYEVLIALADYFEVSTDYLLGRADDFGNVSVRAERTADFPTAEEKKLLVVYRTASEKGKIRIKAYADAVVDLERTK